MTVECPRCGAEQRVRRAGWFDDEDYYELFAALMDAEEALQTLSLDYGAALRQIVALSKARDLLEHQVAGLENDLYALRLELRLLSETVDTL